MTTYVLSKDKPETAPFAFRGDCCICAHGKGSIWVVREMEPNKWHPVTDEKGIPLEWGAVDGLAFNGHISCGVKINHKVVSSGDMIVTIRAEK